MTRIVFRTLSGSEQIDRALAAGRRCALAPAGLPLSLSLMLKEGS